MVSELHQPNGSLLISGRSNQPPNALVIAFPEGGGGETPGRRWGHWGLCGDLEAYLCPYGGGNEGPLLYYAQTKEKYGDLASAKVQGDYLI